MADNFPVIGAFIESVEIDSGIPVGVLQGGDQRIEIGLTGRATHRGDGGIDDIDSCFARLEKRRRIDATRVMRMEVNRQG